MDLYLGIGVAELDCDVTLEFVLEADSLHTRDGLHHRTLPVRYMPNRT